MLVAPACGHASGDTSTSATLATRTLVIGGKDRLDVQIADTPDEREQGLMHVTTLPRDDGMAFVWTDSTTSSFWMKDTLIPLSIAFVGADGTIVSVDEMQPCTADPCPTYASPIPYTMAIEANAHWFADHGVGVGDRVSWRG